MINIYYIFIICINCIVFYCLMGLFGVWIRIVIIICGKFIVFDCENDSGIFEDMDLSILDI